MLLLSKIFHELTNIFLGNYHKVIIGCTFATDGLLELIKFKMAATAK